MYRYIFILLIFIISCTDYTPGNDVEWDRKSVELAVPLFNSELTIPSISEASEIDGNIEINSDGTVVVKYIGDIIRKSGSEIFPPIPGIFDIPLTDTISKVPLPLTGDDDVHQAIIGNTNIQFKFKKEVTGQVNILVTIPQLDNGGEVFSRNFIMEGEDLTTSPISIEGLLMTPENNQMEVIYDARLENGSRIKLSDARISFDFFTFRYIEGRFDSRVFDIRGDIITIGIFEKWKEGGIIFADPSITLEVDNSFGLPTRSKVNKMDIETTEGDILQLESGLINEGIDFEFPALGEYGEVKTTSVIFDGQNSNIVELMSSRAIRIDYDIDALINAEGSDETGFVAEDSYFNIAVAVNLPLVGEVEDLILESSTSIDLSDYEEIVDMEFKINAINRFPLDITAQIFFMDDNTVLDSLFMDEGLLLPGKIAGELQEVHHLEKVSAEMLDDIISATDILVRGKFKSLPENEIVILKAEDVLSFNAGVKVTVE